MQIFFCLFTIWFLSVLSFGFDHFFTRGILPFWNDDATVQWRQLYLHFFAFALLAGVCYALSATRCLTSNLLMLTEHMLRQEQKRSKNGRWLVSIRSIIKSFFFALQCTTGFRCAYCNHARSAHCDLFSLLSRGTTFLNIEKKSCVSSRRCRQKKVIQYGWDIEKNHKSFSSTYGRDYNGMPFLECIVWFSRLS